METHKASILEEVERLDLFKEVERRNQLKQGDAA